MYVKSINVLVKLFPVNKTLNKPERECGEKHLRNS